MVDVIRLGQKPPTLRLLKPKKIKRRRKKKVIRLRRKKKKKRKSRRTKDVFKRIFKGETIGEIFPEQTFKTGTLPIGAKIPKEFIPTASRFIPRFAGGIVKATKSTGKFIVGKPKATAGLVIGLPTIFGALSIPAFKSKVATFFSPFERFKGGQALGTTLTTPKGAETTTGSQGIIDALTSAGLIGAGLVGAREIIRTIKEKRVTEKAVLPTLPSVKIPALPSISQPATLEPIGAVEKEKPVTKEVPAQTNMPDITIRNIVKPNINVSFRKTRKFINQQVLVRQI